MCGRFTLHTEKQLLERQFEVDLAGIELQPSYNVAPSHDVLAVRVKEQQRVARHMRWGLVPRWAKPLERLPAMINARIETIAERPAYRDSFRRRRCLILADGFYEWQSREALPRQPFFVALERGEPFAMAGIWDWWRPSDEPDAERIVSCSIVTAPANAVVRSIHDRMPVILDREHAGAWIDSALDGRVDDLLDVLVPVAAERLVAHTVSPEVNSPDNDDPRLIVEIPDPAPTLF